MPIDTKHAIEKCEALLPTLDPQMRLYLDVALNEARQYQVVRELVAGNIDIKDLDDEDE